MTYRLRLLQRVIPSTFNPLISSLLLTPLELSTQAPPLHPGRNGVCSLKSLECSAVKEPPLQVRLEALQVLDEDNRVTRLQRVVKEPLRQMPFDGLPLSLNGLAERSAMTLRGPELLACSFEVGPSCSDGPAVVNFVLHKLAQIFAAGDKSARVRNFLVVASTSMLQAEPEQQNHYGGYCSYDRPRDALQGDVPPPVVAVEFPHAAHGTDRLASWQRDGRGAR